MAEPAMPHASTEERPRYLHARDRRGHEVDLATILELLDRIVHAWSPEQIWLFGSRGRGEARPTSDWDLFAVVPDGVPEEALGPVPFRRLGTDLQVRADVIGCHVSDFRASRNTATTLAYEVANHGVLLYER